VVIFKTLTTTEPCIKILTFCKYSPLYSSCETKAAKCSGGLNWPMIATIYLKLSNLSLHNKWSGMGLCGWDKLPVFQSKFCKGQVGNLCALFWQHRNKGRGSCSELSSIRSEKIVLLSTSMSRILLSYSSPSFPSVSIPPISWWMVYVCADEYVLFLSPHHCCQNSIAEVLTVLISILHQQSNNVSKYSWQCQLVSPPLARAITCPSKVDSINWSPPW
jgi:hypothetical protein